jgi:dephospho-CoA kinase
VTVIGITGPTGAGKSTALEALEELGAEIIDCDAVYHRMLQSCRPMLDELRARFGAGVFAPDGSLERKALGAVVFGDEGALDDLNRITHRYIKEEVGRLVDEAARAGKPAAAIDGIALLESGLGLLCHHTVAVIAPNELRIARIMARDGIGEDYARARVSAQKGADYFRAHCDAVLDNDGGERTAFRERARALFETLICTGGDIHE